jgi:translocation and assembly module TamB
VKRRWLLYIGGAFLGLALVLTITAFFVARSGWFRDQVRQRIVSEVEKATGGEVGIGSFDFDWKTLRAEVRNFVLHGSEPAGAPPLFRADTIAVELKIISVLRRMLDIAALDVTRPQVHLIVNPDGTTNVPEPKIKKERDKTAMETILDLAIRRFSIQDGLIEVANRSKTPFDGRGENLRAQFTYDMTGPRYRGSISMNPLEFKYGANRPVPMELDLAVVLEKNRIAVENARLQTADSTVTLQGAIDDLVNPRGSFSYKLHLALGQLNRYLATPVPAGGVVNLAGTLNFAGSEDYKLTGALSAADVDYRTRGLAIRNLDATGALTATPGGVHLGNARVSGVVRAGAETEPVRVAGRVASLTYRDSDLSMEGIRVDALGGTFAGNAAVSDMASYQVRGTLSGLRAKSAAGLVSKQELPWDAVVSGPVSIQGSLKGARHMAASAQLKVTPAETGTPVSGVIQAEYDSRRGILDLGTSRLSLPNTSVEFSGSINKGLRVHIETRNFDDLVPLLNLGASGAPRKIPATLNNGAVVFDGTVTGTLQDPVVAGRLSATNVVYESRQFDSLATDLTASPSLLSLRNAVLVRGHLRGRFAAELGLDRWKPRDSSAITASASIQQAPVRDLLALAGQKVEQVSGTLSLDAKVQGTLGDPKIAAELQASDGVLYGEPFDRLTAQVNYTPGRADVGTAQLIAGKKRITARAAFEHPRDSFRNGRLRFQVNSNQMPVEDIHTVVARRPGVAGALQISAEGVVNIDARGPSSRFDLEELKASVSGRGLRTGQQSVGNLRIVAATEGDVLTAHVESDFAGSNISGDGRWKLAGDYPGSADITFSRLNFANLREWISPRPGTAEIGGFAEGSLKLEGPLKNPRSLRAVLEIPELEIGPEPGGNLGRQLRGYKLTNSGPIRVTMEKSVVRVEQARFTGRGTDLALTGTVALEPKTSVDIRAKGDLDLAVLENFNSDIYASGAVVLDAAVRGTFQQPTLNGRLELRDAAVNYGQFPNGLGNANGVILFSGNRASIQSLTGETGGGKLSASGFVQLGQDPVFRLQATADDVRVRYPEGVSTLADANVSLVGTASRSVLSGTITILRTGFNIRSDFSSILASTAEPVRTPAARTGPLANMLLDVQIETAPDISFQTALAQDLQAEADLRLRGTVLSPSLQGRVTITQGEVMFFGTKYTINQGSIAFYNPVKIEPVLNIDLETKARGIDVILTVSGPINKLNVTPRSDPPLQFSEIVALLATGRAPTSDPSLVAREQMQPQTWQQMGASALVGQAIANPVAGRLQRFFGVSRLKIDPSFSGVENNPQARLTLEQQITRDITFTYITNVTSSNPQVIRMEWAFSRQWSVIAVREENGLFGMDFLYKRRF